MTATIPLCINCIHYDDGDRERNYFKDHTCIRPIQSFIYGEQQLNKDPEKERTTGECGTSAKFYIENVPVLVVPFSALSFFRKILGLPK